MEDSERSNSSRIFKCAALWASSGIRIILVALLVVTVAINIADAIGRTFFSAPIFWAEEVLSLLLVMMVAFGLLETAARGRDIRIDLFAHTRNMSGHLRSAIRRAALAASALTCLIAAAAAYQVAEIMWRTGRRSVVVGMEMIWVHGPVLLCLAVAAAIYLIRALRPGGD